MSFFEDHPPLTESITAATTLDSPIITTNPRGSFPVATSMARLWGWELINGGSKSPKSRGKTDNGRYMTTLRRFFLFFSRIVMKVSPTEMKWPTTASQQAQVFRDHLP
jgi:hypothetical protein